MAEEMKGNPRESNDVVQPDLIEDRIDAYRRNLEKAIVNNQNHDNAVVAVCAVLIELRLLHLEGTIRGGLVQVVNALLRPRF